MTLAAGLNWVSNFCVGLFFPSLQHALGNWSFVPFCGVLILVFILTALYIPETRGKTLQQIHASLGFTTNPTHDRDVSKADIRRHEAADDADYTSSALADAAADDDPWDDDTPQNQYVRAFHSPSIRR